MSVQSYIRQRLKAQSSVDIAALRPEDQSCIICLNEYSSGDPLALLRCPHVFSRAFPGVVTQTREESTVVPALCAGPTFQRHHQLVSQKSFHHQVAAARHPAASKQSNDLAHICTGLHGILDLVTLEKVSLTYIKIHRIEGSEHVSDTIYALLQAGIHSEAHASRSPY